MLHAALVVAPIASGRILRIDDRQARVGAGVVGIFSHENAPRIVRDGVFIPLQTPNVHFAGQVVAVVVADTPARARRGAAAIEVSHEAMPAITALPQALDPPFAPRTAGRTGTDSRRGHPESALPAAPL